MKYTRIQLTHAMMTACSCQVHCARLSASYLPHCNCRISNNTLQSCKGINDIIFTWFGGFNSTTVEKKCCPRLYVKVLCNVSTLLDIAITATSDPFWISDLNIWRKTKQTTQKSLRDISHATMIQKLLYCAPPWSVSTWLLRQRLNFDCYNVSTNWRLIIS